MGSARVSKERVQRSLGRRAPRFEPRPRVLVLCEGKLTEPGYLEAFSRTEKAHLVEVEIIGGIGVPKTLVEIGASRKKEAAREARKQRDENLNYEEIWCVFDIDAHPNIEDAKQQAAANGICLAVSNPCFELWLLLHFQDQNAHITREQAQSLCEKHIAGYRKKAPFGKLYPHYDEASDRATKLDKWQKEQGRVGGNPSTGVYKLTDRIRQLGLDAFLRRITGS